MTDGEVRREELESIIRLLTQESERETFENYSLIKSILYNLSIPLPTRLIPKGTTLARCRLHRDELFFTSIDELSYIQDKNKIQTFGRANEINQPIFYCSDIQGVAIAETSEILRDQISKDFELITTSAWRLEEDMVVVNIISNPSIDGVNKMVDLMSREFDEFVEQLNNHRALDLKKFLVFLSTAFTRNVKGDLNKYKLTSAFANYIYDHLGIVDGIMFLSTIYPKEGLNFALRSTSADTKLKFIGARRTRMSRVRDTTDYNETETIDAKSFDLKAGLIQWI